MAPNEAISIAIKIADGLAAGHTAEILHGDLTPENILISDDGLVKILDFGFARQLPTLRQAEDGKRMPNEGPVEYLSPEQVRGEPIDGRSDIFSLGSILYEMAVGRKAFDGYAPLDTMRAILNGDPDEPPSRIPPEFIAILGRCLEKDPANRFQAAEELATGLRTLEQTTQLKYSRRPAASGGSALKRAFSSFLRQRRPVWGPALFGAAAVLIGGAVLARNWELAPKVPDFQRLTFRQGSILRARFAPDGKRVVYTARFDGSPQASYVSVPGLPDGKEIPLTEGSSIAAVSSKGELAIRLRNGELVRLPLDGGSQEQVQTNVFDADWAPDGNTLAVARHAGPGGKFRVEFPVGNPLYETDDPIELVRISPKGDHVAFTTVLGPERRLWVVSKAGSALMLTSLGKGEPVRAVCWSPDGSEIWYASVLPGERGSVEAITVSGGRRRVAWMPDLSLDDVSRDGKALVETLRSWSGVGMNIPERGVNRDLSWHGQTINALISGDGLRVVSTEYEGGGSRYEIYTRTADGSAAVPLGDGEAVAMSPDGRWVTAYSPQSKARYSLLPSVPGEASPIVIPGLEDKTGIVAGWLPDGRRLVWGREAGKKSRHFLWTPSSDQLQAITPEGTPLGYVMADGSRILAGGADNRPYVFFSDGSPARPVLGLTPSDRPLNWSRDGESVFVASQQDDRQTSIYRLSVPNGTKARWSTLDPAIQADGVVARSITPDGKMVVYSYYRSQSELFIASRLR